MVNSDAVGSSIDVLNDAISVIRSFVNGVGTIPAIVGTATLAFTAFSEKGRKMAESFVEMTPGIHRINGLFDTMTEKLNNKSKATQKDIALAKDMISKNKASGESFAGTSIKLAGYNAKLAATKVGMLAVRAAATLMNAALSAGLSMLVSFGISQLAKFIDELVLTKKELQELNSEFVNSNSDNANLSNLINQYKTLTNTMKDVDSGSAVYRETEQKLHSVEKQLLEIYPELNSLLNSNASAKWKNVEAIERMTKSELEAAKSQARVALENNKVRSYEDVEEQISKYKELISKREEYNKLLQNQQYNVAAEDRNAPKNVAKELDKVNKKISESEEYLNTYYTALKTIGEESNFEGSINALESALNVASESLTETGNAASSMGADMEEAVVGVDKLAESIGNLSSPMSLLKTMMEEFKKHGALNDDTYEKVLTSGNVNLIALLADSQNFMTNAQELYSSMRNEYANLAESAIRSSVEQVNALKDVSDAVEDVKGSFDDISSRQSNAIIRSGESIDEVTEKYKDFSNSLMESFGASEQAANELNSAIAESVGTHVALAAQLYKQDEENYLSSAEAKAMANDMWTNSEIISIAQVISSSKDLYDEDLRNWADDVVNKVAVGKQYSDGVISQVAEMITLNANHYNVDTVNWAAAINNKSTNNVKMVNDVIQNIAKMILANAKNYNSDTVNWAKAVTNKSQNNAILCNNITSNMASAINKLSEYYVTDNKNFMDLMNQKKNSLDGFNKYYQQKVGNEFLNPFNTRLNASEQAALWQEYRDSIDKMASSSSMSLNNSYNPIKVNSSPVSSGNFVGSTGNNSSNSGNKKNDSSKKEVEDMEDVVDRYYALNNALQKIENEISAIDTELETKTGKDRIALIEKEIKLLNDKRMALINIRNEQQNELAELRNNLAKSGFGFASDGQISNYSANLSRLVANANKLTGDAKEKAIANVKEVVEQLERYTSLLLDDIPDITNQINGITGSISDLREEIDKIIEDTTFFTKDFVDRYYELNNALKQVENQLNAISTAMKNADDNKLMELLDKQIELYIKQGEALAELKKENVKELNELGKELYDAGFRFNSDGTISNYQNQIDKMVQDANKITDGKKQEKEIERINSLIESIERYTDLLLNDIPDIKNDMDDLANSVIDSQKEIASILSKQKDEYIDNLKKETDALKKEIERRKEILQKQWEQEDAADELEEKQQKLNELEDQLTLALRTGDEELIKNIREQITAAQKEINDFIRDQERDYISDRFDEDLDKIDEDLDKKIDEINEKLSDEELLKLVQSGVRDLTGVLNEIEGGTKGVRNAFAAIGTTISDTWINALDTFVDKLNGLQDINLGFNLESKLSKFVDGISRTFNINQGNLIVQGNITEDILPVVQGMIDTANNNLIRDINAAFSR